MTDTEKRDAVLKEFCEMSFSSHSGNEREERMAAEIVRLRAVVAALREPSDAMVQIIDNHTDYSAMTSDDERRAAIRAVLAEAEREASA